MNAYSFTYICMCVCVSTNPEQHSKSTKGKTVLNENERIVSTKVVKIVDEDKCSLPILDCPSFHFCLGYVPLRYSKCWKMLNSFSFCVAYQAANLMIALSFHAHHSNVGQNVKSCQLEFLLDRLDWCPPKQGWWKFLRGKFQQLWFSSDWTFGASSSSICSRWYLLRRDSIIHPLGPSRHQPVLGISMLGPLKNSVHRVG